MTRLNKPVSRETFPPLRQQIVPQLVRVLPADAFDALELSALAYEGIGGCSAYIYNEDSGEKIAPFCVFGHAEWVNADLTGFFLGGIARDLENAGITTADNDAAVAQVNRRERKPYTDRITFREWCAELGVVRGAQP